MQQCSLLHECARTCINDILGMIGKNLVTLFYTSQYEIVATRPATECRQAVVQLMRWLLMLVVVVVVMVRER